MAVVKGTVLVPFGVAAIDVAKTGVAEVEVVVDKLPVPVATAAVALAGIFVPIPGI